MNDLTNSFKYTIANMNRIFFRLIISLLVLTSCKEEKAQFDLTNTHWISDISMDHEISEFSPSLLFSAAKGYASIHALGYEDALFKSQYIIEDDFLYIAEKETPFFKILSKSDSELYVSLLPGDTTKFTRVLASDLGKNYYLNRFENKTLQVGMGENILAGIIHFTGSEALNFSNDVFADASKVNSNLNFFRIPYGLGYINGIPSLAMGKSIHAKVVSQAGEDLRVQNYFAGSLDVEENNDIGITLYQNNRLERWRLIKVKKYEEAEKLILGAWVADGTRLVFKNDGKVDYVESGIKDTFDWTLDPSGHLIIITKKNDEKLYAVHNLLRDNNKIGFEYTNGRFKDLRRVK